MARHIAALTVATAALFLATLACTTVGKVSTALVDNHEIYELALSYDAWEREHAGDEGASFVDEVLVPRALERMRIAKAAQDPVQSLRDYALTFSPTEQSDALAILFFVRVKEIEELGFTLEETSRIIAAVLSEPKL